MPLYGAEILDIEPMHNWEREDESAWINMLRENEGTYEDSEPEKLDVTKKEFWE
jgi:hypothetical protein